MAQIVLINPRFEVSFWGLEHALPFVGKRASIPVAGLPLIAALTPPAHSVSIVDENVEDLDFEEIAKADLVGVTGMSVQRFRMREILAELQNRDVFTVVGGPWVTVSEDYFAGLADVVFIGEAEITWPQFLRDWANDCYLSRYEQSERTDMTKVPVPRYDLLDIRQYLSGSVQFSRGCPFRCEFCDIIVTFGRRPRLKTSGQVIAELEAWRALGISSVFIVDDNFIGNRRAIKELLHAVVKYQWDRGYPFSFFTETSLDLAEDPELMELMVEANIIWVFIGIESPNEKSLLETKKLQNIGKSSSLVERVHRIQAAGLEVSAGLIAGFDADDESVFEAQIDFVRKARIPFAMFGMLYAIPKTPLYERLASERRVELADSSEYGTNVIPLRMSREELRDGYIRTMNALYEPQAFFERLEDLYLQAETIMSRRQALQRRSSTIGWISKNILAALQTLVLLHRFTKNLPDPNLARFYPTKMRRFAKTRPDPQFLLDILVISVNHYHVYRMARHMAADRAALLSTL